MKARTQMQEGKGIFNNINETNKNYPVGEKQTGWTRQDRTGQGRAGQGRAGQGRAGQGRTGQGRTGQDRAVQYTRHTTMNQHGTANTRRF